MVCCYSAEVKRDLIDCMTKLLNCTYIPSVKMLLSFCGLMYQAVCGINENVPGNIFPSQLRSYILIDKIILNKNTHYTLLTFIGSQGLHVNS